MDETKNSELFESGSCLKSDIDDAQLCTKHDSTETMNKDETLNNKTDSDKSNEFDTTQFYKTLKTQLLKITGDFIREIDLSFDYIDKKIINHTKHNLNSYVDNDIKFKEFYTHIYDILKPCKEKGQLDLQEKVKTKDLEFLNELKLFNISFYDFKDEKKNTKRTLVNYLNEFFIISNFLTLSQGGDSTETLFNEITNIVKNLMQNKETTTHGESILTKSNNVKGKNKTGTFLDNLDIDNLDMIDTNDLSNATGINFAPFDNLLKNKEIMNIATELTNEMQNLEIDPMSIMSSLMTGNMNDNKIGSLISSIGTKLTNKIDSGAINKAELEQQANLFMNNLSSNKDLMSFANNLGNLNGKM